MLKFFRKIRFKIMSENKTGKYFKYAIGEIVLVVIGILIALQINNWNEHNKEIKEEQKLLSNLNSEFIENLHTLDSTLLKIDTSQKSLSRLLRLIGSDTMHNFKGNKLDSLLLKSLDNPYWDRTEFVLRDLENSGRLSKLSNQNLKRALYQWSKLNSSIADKDEDTNISYRYLLNYLKEHGSLRQIDIHDQPKLGTSKLYVDHTFLLSDVKFESAVDDFLIYTQQRMQRLEQAKTVIKSIINASVVIKISTND